MKSFFSSHFGLLKLLKVHIFFLFLFLFLSLFLGTHQLLWTQAHLGEAGGNLGLQLGTISLPLLERVGVRSLLFSRRYIHGYKVPSKYARAFFPSLVLDTKTPYMHGNLG